MKPIPHRHHAAGKRKIRRRLDRPVTAPSPEPVFTASNIHYEVADKTRAIACGGIGAIQLLVRKLGLAEAIDERLHLLKFHLPYHETDHVLNFAYNALCNGTCLDDIELRRNDARLPRRPRRRPHPRPHHRRRLLPTLHPRRRRDPPGRLRSDPGQGLATATVRLLRRGRPRRRRHARRHRRRAASRASTSPTTAPGVITR